MTLKEVVRKVKFCEQLKKMRFYPMNQGGILKGNLCIRKIDQPWKRELMKNPELSESLRSLFPAGRDFHYCGYVIFHKSEVPKQWHGNYDAEGLQYLNIHGGLTYGEIESSRTVNRRIIRKKVHHFITKVYRKRTDAERLSDETREQYLERLNDNLELINAPYKYRKHLYLQNGYDWVVFGFDCNHYRDESNPNLEDENYIWMITAQMEAQLRKFARAWRYYLGSDREEKVQILDIIRGDSEEPLELGMGGLINLLAGKL